MSSTTIESPSSVKVTAAATNSGEYKPTTQEKMKAAICKRYGDPEHVETHSVSRPEPSARDLLIRVSATPVTAADTVMRSGASIIGRLIFGWKRPKIPMLGTGFSGVVVEVGSDVRDFQINDRVFGETGMKFSAHAEYICITEDALVVKTPDQMNDEVAATISDGPLTSFNFLSRIGSVQSGDKVLINGASGSLGTAAIQIALAQNAHVTAVCSGQNAKLVKSLGAHEVIDYTISDFTDGQEQYDVIYDCVGKSSYGRARRALKANGRYICPVFGLHHLAMSAVINLFSRKKALYSATGMLPVDKLKELMTPLLALYREEKIQTVIDQRYGLDEIVLAYTLVDSERKRGNILITMGESPNPKA